ncbi:hypothetical protein KXS07_18290 [Inquilinus limosus]|uniref:hypothetical protein n=1 Tax=Inquilinus limosus TaxID=171674 RepID=UPI003F18B446
MDLSPLAKALPVVAAITLTPLLLRLLGRLFPPGRRSAFDGIGWMDDAGGSFGWIDGIGCLLFIAGLALPLLLLHERFNQIGWPALGLCAGAAVALPAAWICLATLPFGTARFRRYLRYSERKSGISSRGSLALFLPFAVFGVASLIELARRAL